MDPDRAATTKDERDDHRLLLVIAVAGASLFALAVSPALRRALRSTLSIALRLGGLVALARLVADRLGLDEAREAIERDEEEELEWEIPDEIEPDAAPPAKRPRRRTR